VKSTVNMLFMDTLTGKIVMPSEDGAMAEPEHGSPGWTLDTGGQQLVVREDVVEADLYGGVTSRWVPCQVVCVCECECVRACWRPVSFSVHVHFRPHQ
jgi:hypothetical protein